jgi:endonuclease YncB( thermonuclease family)
MPEAKTDGKTLSKGRYEALLSDVQSILSNASHEKIAAYWRVGRRIKRERLVHKAGYHNSVLRDLATDSRLTVRTLQRAVLFHASYSKAPSGHFLNWTHYCALLKLPTDAERARYARLATEQGLTATELRHAISVGLDGVEEPALLERPTQPSYLYSASVRAIVDADTLDLDVDLGFHTFRQERFRLAQIDAPEHKSAAGRKARDFVAKQLIRAQTVVVKTGRVDLYGRYVVHLFHSRKQISIDDCFLRGEHLNNQLLAHKLARYVG